MEYDKIEKIFEEVESDLNNVGDNAFEGLKIISKYTKNPVQGADHDILYSEDIEKLIEAGITEEDVIKLSKLNWMINDEYLVCFV